MNRFALLILLILLLAACGQKGPLRPADTPESTPNPGQTPNQTEQASP